MSTIDRTSTEKRLAADRVNNWVGEEARLPGSKGSLVPARWGDIPMGAKCSKQSTTGKLSKN